MRVLVASPDKDEIVGRILPALEMRKANLLGYVISADSLLEKIQALAPDLVIVRADLAARGEEVNLLQKLGGMPASVILPKGRAGMREPLLALANVRAVAVLPDVDYAGLLPAPEGEPADGSGLIQAVRSGTVERPAIYPDAISAGQMPSLEARGRAGRRRAQCLCLAGVKGGVGATTAVCALAVAAAQKRRVGVADLTGTGDVQATLPKDSPVERLAGSRAELVADWPRLKAAYDLVLLDGGRFPLPSFSPLSVVPVGVTRDDTTDRLPPDALQVVVTQAARAPVGLKANAVLPVQPDLYEQLAAGCFLQPGPLLEAALSWAHSLEVR